MAVDRAQRRLPVRFWRNTSSAYLLTIISAGLALVVTPLLTGGMSTRAYGIWTLAGSTVVYLELFQLGFSAGATKLIAETIDADEDERARAVSTSFWSLVPAALIALAIGAVLALVFPLVFDVGRAAGAARVLVAVLAVNTAVSIPCAAFGGVLMAHQHHLALNVVLSGVVVVQWLAWAVIVEAGGGLVALGVAATVANVAGQLLIVALARPFVPRGSLTRRRAERDLARSFRALSVWLALVEVAAVVIDRVDLLIVGSVLGVREAAVYAVGVKLSSMGGRLVGPMAVTFLPFASQVSVEDGREAMAGVWITATRLVLAVAGPVCVTLIVLCRPAIDLWVGSRYRGASVVVACLAAAALFGAIKLPGAKILSGMGVARPVATFTVVEAMLNVALALALAPAFGLTGIAVAVVVASGVVNLGAFVPYVARTLAVPLHTYLASVARAHVPAAGAVAVASPALVHLAWTGRPGLVAAATVSAVLYVAVFALTGLEHDERTQVMTVLRRRRVATAP